MQSGNPEKDPFTCHELVEEHSQSRLALLVAFIMSVAVVPLPCEPDVIPRPTLPASSPELDIGAPSAGEVQQQKGQEGQEGQQGQEGQEGQEGQDQSWSPSLAGDWWEHFENHQLPGDDLVSLRFKAQRNYKPLLFLPCLLMSFATDSPVVCSETKPEMEDVNGTISGCTIGDPTVDVLTRQTVCPVVCGFSPMWTTIVWFSWFILTIVYAWRRGRGVDRDEYYSRQTSDIAHFIGCSRAGYDDNHLIVIVILISMCALHSVLVRFAAQPDAGGYDNACIRFGNWSALEDVCPAGRQECDSVCRAQ